MRKRQMIAFILGVSIVFPILGEGTFSYASLTECKSSKRNTMITNWEESTTFKEVENSHDTVISENVEKETGLLARESIEEKLDMVADSKVEEKPNTITGGGIEERPDTVTGGSIEEKPDIVTSGGIVENPETVTSSGIKTDTVVTFEKGGYQIPYTRSKKIVVMAVNKDGEAVKVRYKSANPKIAEVDKNGNVTGISVGTTTITATAMDKSKAKAVCTIHVYKQKKGWYENKSGKKYYVKKDGTRVQGYTKINGSYYFGNKNGYIITNKWKYVKISGRKYKLYFGEDGKQVQNVLSVIGAQKKYKIEVNVTQNLVIVYAKDGKNGFIIPVKAMVCSCGVEGRGTRQGNYSYLTRAGKWHYLKYGVSGKYCTRYSGPYLFHSVTYSTYGDNYSLQAEEYEKLGTAASHGCIRLMVKDAKWIYKNYKKCKVSIFASNKKAPLKKPIPEEVVKLGKKKAYDPTDPDCK